MKKYWIGFLKVMLMLACFAYVSQLAVWVFMVIDSFAKDGYLPLWYTVINTIGLLVLFTFIVANDPKP